jgi:hypothetical protein
MLLLNYNNFKLITNIFKIKIIKVNKINKVIKIYWVTMISVEL